MKGLIETFVGCVYLVLVVFTIGSFSVVGMQMMMARHYHTSVINQIQASYYAVDIGAINDKLHETYPNWNVTSTVIHSVNNREDRLVTLTYEVDMPLFNIKKQGRIDGYAR